MTIARELASGKVINDERFVMHPKTSWYDGPLLMENKNKRVPLATRDGTSSL